LVAFFFPLLKRVGNAAADIIDVQRIGREKSVSVQTSIPKQEIDSQEAELDALSTGLTNSEFRISLIWFSLRVVVVVEHGVKQSKADRIQGRAKSLHC